MSDLPHDAKSSYEHTRTTEPEGRMLPPWEKLGIEMRIALINAYSFGASRALDMIASKGRSVLSGTPSERVAQRSEQAAHNGTAAGSTPAAFTTSDGWHDISTAPKDGTEILAWDGDYVIVKANQDGGWSDDFQQYLRLDKWMPLPPRPGDRTDSGEAQSISLNQTSIPEGYVLVPREPDADMAEVARDWAQRDWNAFGDPKGYLKFYQGIYRAMINAVPKPEGE